ncbi:hypothetical protein GCM10007160_31310 [Litchfieldella qijiaojingensis]|uniref:Uncharacterized protein n=1 Tax=Litchfieldella qijiaojingensis TaxID=980347 RepID=A0ABQ2Z0G3_9GAMM|nr:hypothetical protein GCM10007160_31310 [Halomonas qijiaojingensis]
MFRETIEGPSAYESLVVIRAEHGSVADGRALCPMAIPATELICASPYRPLALIKKCHVHVYTLKNGHIQATRGVEQ